MIVDVNDKLRVRFDSTCWSIEARQDIKAGKEKGGVRWPSIGYYGSLHEALFAIVRKHTYMATDQERMAISEVHDLINKIGERLVEVAKTAQKQTD